MEQEQISLSVGNFSSMLVSLADLREQKMALASPVWHAVWSKLHNSLMKWFICFIWTHSNSTNIIPFSYPCKALFLLLYFSVSGILYCTIFFLCNYIECEIYHHYKNSVWYEAVTDISGVFAFQSFAYISLILHSLYKNRNYFNC